MEEEFIQNYNNENKDIYQNINEYNNNSSMINNILNNDNNNFFNNSLSSHKKYLNFSSEKNSNLKNLNLEQILDLDTETKAKINLNSDIIYNEIINNLNDIVNKLQIEDSRKQNFFSAKNNLYLDIKYFLNSLINLDEEKANKLMIDLEDIKSKYDYYLNNINETTKMDWEILDDLITNYNDYCMDVLKNIVNINNIKEFIFLLKININQIIRNYFNYKDKQNNILLTNNKSKNFLNNKRNSENNDKSKEEIHALEAKKNNVIILSKDEKGIFNKYIYYRYKNNDIKNIYDKNLIPKYIDLSFYISKKEKIDNILQIINNIKLGFKKYLITYKNNIENNYLKIKFCGIYNKPKIIIKQIKYLMKNLLKEKTIIKIKIFSNLKECLYKVINKININEDNSNIGNNNTFYDYYTTNINNLYLVQLIYK